MIVLLCSALLFIVHFLSIEFRHYLINSTFSYVCLKYQTIHTHIYIYMIYIECMAMLLNKFDLPYNGNYSAMKWFSISSENPIKAR